MYLERFELPIDKESILLKDRMCYNELSIL